MADYEVVAVRPAPAKPTPSTGSADDRYEVGQVRAGRQYRGARGQRGLPDQGTNAPGRSPDAPIPYGQPVPVGSYGLDGTGKVVLRTRTGWNIVSLPGTNRPADVAARNATAPIRRENEQREAARARPTEARPDRGVFGWRVEDATRPFRNALSEYDATQEATRARSAERGGLGLPRNLSELGADVGNTFRADGARFNMLMAPVSGAINEITAPIARGMTNLGIANDDYNNDALTRATMLIAPERPRGLALDASRARMAPVTGAPGSRPTVANALAEAQPYATAPQSAVRAAGNPLSDAAPPKPAPARPARPARRVARPNTRAEQVAALKAEGIEPTPGQRAGPAFAAAEDKAMSIPGVGDAIGGARTRGMEQLNRAVANRALGEIGDTLPPNVRPGRDAYAYTERRVGEVYDEAADMVSGALVDDAFAQDMAAIRVGNNDLPGPMADDFERIVKARLGRLEAGPVDGATLKQVQSELRGLATSRRSSPDPGARDLGDQLDKVARAIGGIVERNNPKAAALIAKADKAWRGVATMRRAASGVGAPNGVFSPAQLRAAVKAGDKSVGKGATARGDAYMQDLSDAAAEVMAGKVPDSGTVGRALFSGVVGGAAGVGAVLSPAGLKAAAIALGVSIPYLLTARKLAGTALNAKSAAQRAEALTSLEAMGKTSPGLGGFIGEVRSAAGRATPSALVGSGSAQTAD